MRSAEIVVKYFVMEEQLYSTVTIHRLLEPNSNTNQTE